MNAPFRTDESFNEADDRLTSLMDALFHPTGVAAEGGVHGGADPEVAGRGRQSARPAGTGAIRAGLARLDTMRSLLIISGDDSTSRSCRPMLLSPSLR